MARNAFTRSLSNPIPQSEPADPRQVQNNAGGYTFTVDSKSRLERFLIIGTDGGTYYVDEKKLTKENVAFLDSLIAEDEAMVLRTILDVSTNARAYRNSPAIFAMAKLLVSGKNKRAVIDAGPQVVRTSTHLFEFASYIELLGGWGRAKREFIARWYQGKSTRDLAYQAVKYRQRDGWTHRDLWRLAHPKGLDQVLGRWVLGQPGVIIDERPDLNIVRAFEVAQQVTTMPELMSLMDQDYAKNLPWEALPTQFLREPEVWKKLFYSNNLNGQALVRNVTRLARIGAFNDMVFARNYADKLANEEMIVRTRLHPLNYLNAVVVHESGQIQRQAMRESARYGYSYASTGRQKNWNTVPVIMDALNAGFYTAFKNVVPSNKRTLIAVDVSSSMSYAACLGLDISAAQAAAAMSMMVARTEPYYQIMGFSTQFKDLGITPSDNLNSTMRKVQLANFGGTDCSLPMSWARQARIEVDTFLVLTDNETWAGGSHPHMELRNYRSNMGIDAKLVVAGVASTGFTIADPDDRGMLDVVGFDANAPKIIAEFSVGQI